MRAPFPRRLTPALITAPIAAKPTSIIAQAEGSGTALVGGGLLSPPLEVLELLEVELDVLLELLELEEELLMKGPVGKGGKPCPLKKFGVPGTGDAPGDITRLYVAHLHAPSAGTYTLRVAAAGKTSLRGTLRIVVLAHPRAPAVGSKAIASQTPTIASTHGNLAELTTRTPPDTKLLDYSVAGSIAAHKRFVLVFATPKFCQSRTCGPVVDVVDAVRKQFTGSGIRFIHVEVYKNNNPGLGYNQWVKQWHLPSEPWIFLVGSDGRIKARFEGSVSVQELAASVKQHLS